jgi:hypothetical protein
MVFVRGSGCLEVTFRTSDGAKPINEFEVSLDWKVVDVSQVGNVRRTRSTLGHDQLCCYVVDVL